MSGKARTRTFEIIGNSPQIEKVLRDAKSLANAEAPVLIAGEKGTGKELIARAIHRMGQRRTQAFAKLDCSRVLTDPSRAKFFEAAGQRLKVAGGGTLLLKHIEDIAHDLRPKVLQFVENAVTTDVRLIMTASDPRISDPTFWLRQSLSADANPKLIRMPPLRERPDDIQELAEHFAKKWSCLMHKPNVGIAVESMERLVQYHWPNNVRELEIVIQKATGSSDGPEVRIPAAWLRIAS